MTVYALSTTGISRFLLQEVKMDPNAKNNDGDTPLHTACRNRRSQQVTLLVRDERCNPHEKDSRGDTALHIGCRLSNRGIILIALINCSVCDSLTTHSVLVVGDLDCNVYIPALYSVRVYMCVD